MMEQIDSFELDELRQQHAILKDKINKQAIINDGMLKKAMRRNLRSLNKEMRRMGALGIFAAIYCPFVFYKILDTSLAFALFTLFALLIIIALHLYQMRILPKTEDLSESLPVLDARVAKFLRWKNIRLSVGLTLIFIMVIWLIFEVQFSGYPFIIILILSAILGLYIGLRVTFKMRREARSIRHDLEKLERLRNNEDIND